ncbi:hypothetical protein A2833_03445 [Candidatus Azambacteria bacterium RIFCSPHIGHO2_01_FULL_44_55]|uniref:Sporulation protein YhbH n=1 Tax=Candidatus Azambacteria bacterium RIFCSPLOWO2_02_FULL_44_14 TaxID=1797306 RepID=A0A1F5CCE7_9BACT|nr:MAG: hypothetical protein A3A18_00790 [Candidatus Azambacteria bacterium RIFCSPLOWO2_01_FULL_44_84]OGD32877.1 MAG: hypothetical protein A3C78_00935 [Candidatus Azambacteria bacterium RIFCSPHIGHO2_02_FULL_45_18]OGD40043.1 MAG: hypothetical protein A2833_03445 [Candidatus Azambacteria bacterium RIFCSPHIGHO2_01_FULL_44_55]OGD40533.1 MAG: hypothetical protein A3I30_01790 [Candidatus Azambacteria bacterium RIFCSPLOWO2_02_FULL_44_14]OGD52259.1 MAG: hypothetical protein A2608_02800 [Candidatus Azam
MPIFVPETISERGKADAKRHREKQREVIKKNLPEIIADESIITGKKGKIVKIPIKSIEIPYFKSGKGGKGVGVGQGDGKIDDVIGKKPGYGSKPGQAGTQPGEDYIETEVEIEELIEMMLEDLGLPKLQEKETKQLIQELGWKIHGQTRSGPWVLLNRRATAKEGIKRFYFFLNQLVNQTGKDELTCFSALKKAKGVMIEALKILEDSGFICDEKKVEPFPVFSVEDLRFHKIEPDIRHLSKAVILAMMDVSGSMTTTKKYLARSMLFWLVAFLRKIYVEVEIRFIIHHTIARVVDEDNFFGTRESGGTYCYTAYEEAGSLIDAQYPTNQWNVYVWHFSDGEDFDIPRTVEEIKKLFSRDINMLGYGEIKPAGEYGFVGTSNLFSALNNNFAVHDIYDNGFRMMSGKNEPLFGAVIERKEHLLPALKGFLKKDRWAEVVK